MARVEFDFPMFDALKKKLEDIGGNALDEAVEDALTQSHAYVTAQLNGNMCGRPHISIFGIIGDLPPFSYISANRRRDDDLRQQTKDRSGFRREQGISG